MILHALLCIIIYEQNWIYGVDLSQLFNSEDQWRVAANLEILAWKSDSTSAILCITNETRYVYNTYVLWRNNCATLHLEYER